MLLMSILHLSKIRLPVKPLFVQGRPVAHTNYESTEQSIGNQSLVPAVSSTPTAHFQLFGSYYSSVGEELEQAAYYMWVFVYLSGTCALCCALVVCRQNAAQCANHLLCCHNTKYSWWRYFGSLEAFTWKCFRPHRGLICMTYGSFEFTVK